MLFNAKAARGCEIWSSMEVNKKVLRTKARFSCLNKRELQPVSLTCMVNKLMQFRRKKKHRIKVRTTTSVAFTSSPSFFSIVFLGFSHSTRCRRCRVDASPQNAVESTWRMLKTRSNAPLTLTTTKSFIISVLFSLSFSNRFVLFLFFFERFFFFYVHVQSFAFFQCSFLVFPLKICIQALNELRTQLVSSLRRSIQMKEKRRKKEKLVAN